MEAGRGVALVTAIFNLGGGKRLVYCSKIIVFPSQKGLDLKRKALR